MDNETKYIVGSGAGYFVRFVGDTPEMTSDPLCGTRVSASEIEDIIIRMEAMGFEAYIITIRKGLYVDQPAEAKENPANPLKRFFCWLGWHSFTAGFEGTGFDGASKHARCKWCGYEGMIDSQGNLF